MPATAPEQIHRLFEDMFNSGDIEDVIDNAWGDQAVTG